MAEFCDDVVRMNIEVASLAQWSVLANQRVWCAELGHAAAGADRRPAKRAQADLPRVGSVASHPSRPRESQLLRRARRRAREADALCAGSGRQRGRREDDGGDWHRGHRQVVAVRARSRGSFPTRHGTTPSIERARQHTSGATQHTSGGRRGPAQRCAAALCREQRGEWDQPPASREHVRPAVRGPGASDSQSPDPPRDSQTSLLLPRPTPTPSFSLFHPALRSLSSKLCNASL
eukprot:1423808-Rhodomonas_salina.2